MQSISKTIKSTKTSQALIEVRLAHSIKAKWLTKGATYVPNNLIRDRSVSPSARFVYILLLGRAFGDKDYCFPSQGTLATESGYSRGKVNYLIRELREAHWIFVTRRGQGKSCVYTLNRFYDDDFVNKKSQKFKI